MPTNKESIYQEAFNKFQFKKLSSEEIKSDLLNILTNKKENDTLEVRKRLLNCVDLTSLKSTDNEEEILNLIEKVNKFENEFPELSNVAAICVYPNFASLAKNTLEAEQVKVACVSGGFPSSQTFIEIKIAETSLAIQDGAEEIDIVLSVGKLLNRDYETLCEEIQELKDVCRENTLKVILETGLLQSAENIKRASILAIYSGADFIKTSTGKEEPAATPEAAYIMCQTIKEYYDLTGIKIGFKPAGGLKTVDDAITYYTIVKEVLGEEWLNNRLFRLGTSSLANLLLADIIGKKIKFF